MQDICKVCGKPIPPNAITAAQQCDGCSGYICDRCYVEIPTVHTTKPTEAGMTGFLKLCPECQEKYKDVIKDIERPYLG